MTLSDPMEDAAAARPPVGTVPREAPHSHDGHRHDPHTHAGHDHSHSAPASAPVSRRRRDFASERVFLASAVERMAFALVLVAAIWLAVFWAMG